MKTSRDVFDVILSLKNLLKHCPSWKVIVLNVSNRSGNGKVSLTVENVNDHRDPLNIDVMGKRNIAGNC